MRLILLAALFAPSAAFACAMPHYDEKQLAKVMAEIDAAAVPTPVKPADKATPAPTVYTQSVIPEAQPTTPAVRTPPPTSAPRS